MSGLGYPGVMIDLGRRAALAALLLAAAALAGCGSDACPPVAEKSAIYADAGDWYLYQDLLAPTDPRGPESPAEYLDLLTAKARAGGLDRYWSYLLTREQAQQYFQAGQSAGFGFGFQVSGARLFLTQVMRGSPADQAGFQRGDEILAVGPDQQHPLTPMATLLPGDPLAPCPGSTPGTVCAFQVQPVGTTAGADVVVRQPTRAVYDLDPVVAQVIPGTSVGYVHLRTFVASADDRLRQAFQSFKQAGVTGVIVDVRYDGGGLLATAQVLASLLHPAPGDLMYRFAYDAAHGSQSVPFGAEPYGLGSLTRVAFIATGATASASELVPNALAPYLQVAIVGDRSYGKPVGQVALDLPSSCADALYLIAFRLENSQGYGGYYGGLPAPGFAGSSCQAADDLAHAQGSSAEASTAAALSFVTTGACGTPITPAAATAATQLRASRPAPSYPQPASPTPAQRDIPGLY